MPKKYSTESPVEFKPNPKQVELSRMMRRSAQNRHVMAFGGARSGKTFWFCRQIAIRALKEPNSRHVIARHRFNAVKQYIGQQTWPEMMQKCFPEVKKHRWYRLDKQDWVIRLPNESEIWLGGLDDQERTEKILGSEYVTAYLNECSQISYSARNMMVTRLAQVNGLHQIMLYDCNPPSKAHWTYKVFIQGVDPLSKQAIPDFDQYASLSVNPVDNKENLTQEFLRSLENLPERQKRRFWLGQFLDENENALWSPEMIDNNRFGVVEGDTILPTPDFQRVIVAVDPSGADEDEEKNNDEIGIVVAALGVDGHAYVLEDCTLKAGPMKWGNIAARAFDRHKADLVVGESNFGGGMVEFVIQSARPNTPYKPVTASRGKVVRAEPIAALYAQGKVHHMGHFADLEDELLAFSTAGYTGTRSPNRADALVWALTELFPGMTRKANKPVIIEGLGDYDVYAF